MPKFTLRTFLLLLFTPFIVFSFLSFVNRPRREILSNEKESVSEQVGRHFNGAESIRSVIKKARYYWLREATPLTLQRPELPASIAPRLTTASSAAFNWCAEAESGSGNRNAEKNSQASGGQVAGGFGGSSEYMSYTVSGVPSAGSYTLHLWYTSAENPQFGIVVNSVLQTASASGNGSWTGPFLEKPVTVNLQAGTNTVRIQGVGGGGNFTLDRLCVDGGACSPPSLYLNSVGCTGSRTYALNFTTQTGAVVTTSAGRVEGDQVVAIPAGTSATVTASLGGCSTQQVATSPTCGPGCGSGSGLTGTYYNTNNFSQAPVVARTDAQINFFWGPESPIPGIINSNNYSIRWEGQLEAPVTGTYTFITNNDDATRLWIDGQLLIDDWQAHIATVKQNTISLTSGRKYAIKIEFAEYSGDAQALLYWQYGSQSTQIVPSCWLYPGVTCTPPSLSLNSISCTDSRTYSLNFTTQTGAVVTTSAGRVENGQVVNIPVGTSATVTASLGGCSAQQVATSPSCGLTPGTGTIALLPYTDQGWPDAQDNKILENEYIQVRFSKSVGGGVTWISRKPSTQNLINVSAVGTNPDGSPKYDTGRLLGYSTYCTPSDNTFVVNGKRSQGIGANTVQGGNILYWNDRGVVEKSAFVQTADRGTVLCFRARGKFWDIPNEPGHTPFDVEAWLEGNTLRLRCNVVVEERTAPRFPQQPQYMARNQELPCMYGIAELSVKLGKVSGQEKNLTENIQPQLGANSQAIITDDCAIGMYSTDQTRGLTLVTPRNTIFGAWQSGGYQGDWLSTNCSYVTAKDNLNLDITGTYQQDAYIIVGSRKEALAKIAQIPKDNSFSFDFTQDNHRWSNGDGAMRRTNGKLIFEIGTPNHDDARNNTASFNAPYRHYNAATIPAIDFKMAVTNSVNTITLNWSKLVNGVVKDYSKPMSVNGDSVERIYTVSTSDPNFNGDIIRIGLSGVNGMPAQTKLVLISATVHQ